MEGGIFKVKSPFGLTFHGFYMVQQAFRYFYNKIFPLKNKSWKVILFYPKKKKLSLYISLRYNSSLLNYPITCTIKLIYQTRHMPTTLQ